MSVYEYELWLRKRWGDRIHKPTMTDRFVIATGFGGENGEVLELLKKEVRDGKQIKADLILELGDQRHYLCLIGMTHGFNLHDIMEANIEKLEARDKDPNKPKGWVGASPADTGGKPL